MNNIIEEVQKRRSSTQVKNVNLRSLKIFNQNVPENILKQNLNQVLKNSSIDSSDINYNPFKEISHNNPQEEEKKLEVEENLKKGKKNEENKEEFSYLIKERINYSNFHLFNSYKNFKNDLEKLPKNGLLLSNNNISKVKDIEENYNKENNYNCTTRYNTDLDNKTVYCSSAKKKNNLFSNKTPKTTETEKERIILNNINSDSAKKRLFTISQAHYNKQFSAKRNFDFPNKDKNKNSVLFMSNYKNSKMKYKMKPTNIATSLFPLCNNYNNNKSKSSHKKKKIIQDNNNNSNKNNNGLTMSDHLKMLIKYRKRYPFICDPNPLLPMKFADLPDNIININKKYSSVLRKENNKVFEQYFSVISKDKFDQKFQNITAETESKEEKEFLKHKKDKKIINEEIVSGRRLIKEIDEKKVKQEIKNVKKRKQYRNEKFKKAVIYLMTKIKNLQVDISEIIKTYRLPRYSFACLRTRELIFAIRTKNLSSANELLDKYKFMVLDFDYFHLTALHWAAKTNFYNIIPKLMEYGAFVDSEDFTGNTPLMIAIQHNYVESVVLLFLYLASPFCKDSSGKSITDFTNDYQMKFLIQKITKLHTKYYFGPTKNFYSSVQKDFADFIVDEYKYNLEPDAFSLVKEKADIYNKQMKKNY